MKKSIVISLGGSIMVPDSIDTNFLKKFKEMLLGNIKYYHRIFIITGGGALARIYQKAAYKVGGQLHKEDIDWLGIHATRLNAHLLRSVFRRWAHRQIITKPLKDYDIKSKIVIGSGWKPGWSTDYISVLIAQKYGIKEVLNLSDISYVYDKDPKKFKDAKKLTKIKWSDFRKMVGNKWVPGLNFPFDPIASRLAQKEKIKVIVMSGKKLSNVDSFLQGKKFKGTEIFNQ